MFIKEKNNYHCLDCETTTDNLSRIKKEFAEIFGSKLSFCPKMTLSALSLAAILLLNLSTAWAACNEGDFDCNGESGSSAYCCYHVVSETNGLKNIEIYKDPAAGNNPGKVGESAFDADYDRGQDIGTVVIKEGISQLGEYAFYMASLTSVDMPKVTSIGYGAFAEASLLQSVDMPNVTSLGYGAFLSASSLQSVDMPNVTSIGDSAFANASSLAYAGLNQDEHVYVSMGVNAFNNTNISGCHYTGANCGSCPIGQSVMPGRGCVTECGVGFTADVTTKRCVAASPQATEDSCRANGQVFWKNACFDTYPFTKKRWTPAEAAQWLNEDNNTITITFKKQ